MIVLERMQSSFHQFFAERGVGAGVWKASYPSEEWNTLSWSHWLLEDLILGAKVWELAGLRSTLRARLFAILGTKVDLFSYHGDASRKIYLYKLLSNRKSREVIVIPECGPCGFDIMIAKMAGYRRILSYDIDPSYVECCRFIWGDGSVEFEVSSSENYPLEELPQDFDLVAPDWAHGDLLNRNIRARVIRYSDPTDFDFHLRKLKKQDYSNFFHALSRL